MSSCQTITEVSFELGIRTWTQEKPFARSCSSRLGSVSGGGAKMTSIFEDEGAEWIISYGTFQLED